MTRKSWCETERDDRWLEAPLTPGDSDTDDGDWDKGVWMVADVTEVTEVAE